MFSTEGLLAGHALDKAEIKGLFAMVAVLFHYLMFLDL